jgi:hypothetical protein
MVDDSDAERAEAGARDAVERQLAQFTFMREEREREVRLLFRDVPADEVARAFRSAGASLITLAGERVGAPAGAVPPVDEHGEQPTRKRRTRRKSPAGEVVVRYFYALGEMVYTVGIVSSAGVLPSVAGIYPGAAICERELRDRFALVFH